jgi:hypothetical protein
MKLWPKRSWSGLVRFSFLTLALIVVIIGVFEIRNVGRAGEAVLRAGIYIVGGRFFEGVINRPSSDSPNVLKLDATYTWSLARQMSLIEEIKQYYSVKKVFPKTIQDLVAYGITSSDLLDPWKRPYRLHVLDGHVIIIQSTGPSGVDRLPSEQPLNSGGFLTSRVQLVGDNLIVGEDLWRVER